MSDQRGKTVSVYLDNELDELVVEDANDQERSKSQIINKIVRAYYKSKGRIKTPKKGDKETK